MSTDETINATVRALAAGKSLKLHDVARSIEMPTSTFDRRLAKGGWTAEEAARLAAVLGVGLEDLATTGIVRVAPDS